MLTYRVGHTINLIQKKILCDVINAFYIVTLIERHLVYIGIVSVESLKDEALL